jgi:ABC-type branched-subunit amino acid transport system permease subunit
VFEFLIVQTLNGLVYCMLLFLLALGLSLTFGLLRVINLAHGAFFLMGAYFGLSAWSLTHSFWLTVLAASVGTAAVGALLERIWLQRFYVRNELDQVILTFGFSLVFADIMKMIWGKDIRSIPAPSALSGTIEVAGIAFPSYRLLLIAIGVILFVGTWFAIERTRAGALIRASVADRVMVSGLGFNIRLLFTTIFAFGTAVAGLAGVLGAPITGIYPGLDFEVLITTRRSWKHLRRAWRESADRPRRNLRQGFVSGDGELHCLRTDGCGSAPARLGTRRRGSRMKADVLAQRRGQPSEAPRIWVPLALIFIGLAAAPLFGMPQFAQSLIIEILIFSLLALSLNILLGYTGLVSFGHAAFFGIGGYAIAILATRLTTDILVAMPLAIAISALCAVPIGWLSVRLSGFYFLMITFAFAQIVYVAAFRWKWLTGGSDGMLVPTQTFLGIPVLFDRQPFYFFTLAVFAVCCVLLYLIVASQFGRTLIGIRESTPRMRALGYNVRRYKVAAFVIGATFGGVSGVLNSQFNLFIAPESAHWTQSALVLVMVLIGGAGYFVGPIIGTTIVILLQHWLSSYTESWGLVLGLLFIALITGAREGIAGLVAQAADRVRARAT